MNTATKDPSLKIRYAMGLGDFVACILHSKFLSKLTKYISGKDKPCQTCSLRAQALNILFPIPFWRLFFKSKELMLKSYKGELEASGYKVQVAPDGSVSGIKTHVTNSNKPKQNLFPEIPALVKDPTIDYILINSHDTRSEGFLIRTQVFKTK